MQTIRRIFVALAMLVLGPAVIAEVPQIISYQGYLTNPAGQPAGSGDYQITFSIYDTAQGGLAIWTSGEQTVLVTGGQFDYLLGSAVPLPDDLFTDSLLWLGIKVGTDDELSPRIRLATVPYAYHSLRSDTADFAEISPAADDGDWTASGDDLYRLSGNIGIGTSTPSYRFTLEGGDVVASLGSDASTVKLANNAEAFIGGYNTGGGQTTTYLANNIYYTTALGWTRPNPDNATTSMFFQNGNVTFKTGTTDLGDTRLAILNDGNVGIGTAAPGARLDVYARGDNVSLLKLNTERAWVFKQRETGSSSRLCLEALSGNKAFDIRSYGGYRLATFYTIEGGGNIDFNGYLAVQADIDASGSVTATTYYGDGSNLTGISGTIDNDWIIGGGNVYRTTGNVGIGTSIPDRPLHVYHATTNGVALVESGDHEATINFKDNNTGSSTPRIGAQGDNLVLLTGSSTPAMTIDVTREVGIGTTSPAAKLDVNGDMRLKSLYPSASLQVGQLVPFTLVHADAGMGAGDVLLRTSAASTGGDIFFAPRSSTAMTVKHTGSVGIGTITPSFTLDVRGTIGGASGQYHPSDGRLKKDVRTVLDALHSVERLRGVSFEWRRDEYPALNLPDGRQLGLIAHEVEAVCPELVTAWGDEKYGAVDYGRLTAVLVEAIKEQQTQIKNLKQRVKELESR